MKNRATQSKLANKAKQVSKHSKAKQARRQSYQQPSERLLSTDLLDDKDCKRGLLAHEKGDEVVEQDVQMMPPVSIRYDDGSPLLRATARGAVVAPGLEVGKSRYQFQRVGSRLIGGSDANCNKRKE